MEDIIGFEEQIGAPFRGVFNRAIKNPLQAATMKAKTNLASKLNQRNIAIAKRISKGLPLPINIKNAIVKTANAGKPLPSIIKRGLAIAKQKKAIVPIALPKRTRAQIMQRAVEIAKQKSIVPQKTRTQIMQRAVEIAKQKGIIPVSTLTRVTNPMQVNRATPIQKSFMPVDLPYQNFAPNTAPLRITATNYKLPTSINLVEPSVDAGTPNYYGK